jgi:hypothetical protein
MLGASIGRVLIGVLSIAPLLTSGCFVRSTGGACWGPTSVTSDWRPPSGVLDDGGLDCRVACTSTFGNVEVMPDSGCVVDVDAGLLTCDLRSYCTL